jgi:hypothetical protein
MKRERWLWATIVAVLTLFIETTHRAPAPPALPAASSTSATSPTASCACPAVAINSDPWAPLTQPAKLHEPPTVWDVLTYPDQLVGRPTTLAGYLVIGFEFAHLAQTKEEVMTFDRWRAERPREHPRLRLLGLNLSKVDRGGQPTESDHGRRVSVSGVVVPALHPSEPDPALRWAYGIGFKASALTFLP